MPKKTLYEELSYEQKNRWDKLNEAERAKTFEFCKDYADFLSAVKTEREACEYAVEAARLAGFAELGSKRSLKPGDKVYKVNRGKGIMLAVIGKRDMSEGVNLVGAHTDVPRIDLKQNPLFEDNGLVYFKTHYYGGIKKYQWTATPLALHGVIIKQDGSAVNVKIGEEPGDPVLCITDLLPHLAQEQMQKKMSEAVAGESLNILVGNIPFDDSEIKEKSKFNILKFVHEKYNISEEDFISAELEAMPAGPARDVGLDRGMIGGYGHDDRVCAYTALRGILELKNPDRPAVCLLVDKEEVGSMGNTGAKSRFFENTLAKLISLCEKDYSDLKTREALSNSVCLSADVGVAFDPNFPDVCEKRNTAVMNGGLMLTKYTGSRGKSGASDASAELVAKVRDIFNKNGVLWQCGELGKVDFGGGGTIAQYVANLDVDVIDCGVPLFSMHSPFEVAGKLDVYMAYKGYTAFYKS